MKGQRFLSQLSLSCMVLAHSAESKGQARAHLLPEPRKNGPPLPGPSVAQDGLPEREEERSSHFATAECSL